jgi:hypothetical protein
LSLHPFARRWRRPASYWTRKALANKDDPHSIKVFDPLIKGETNRFAYRFVKP